jgi:hypothetical protein
MSDYLKSVPCTRDGDGGADTTACPEWPDCGGRHLEAMTAEEAAQRDADIAAAVEQEAAREAASQAQSDARQTIADLCGDCDAGLPWDDTKRTQLLRALHVLLPPVSVPPEEP